MKMAKIFKKGLLDSRTAGINECRMSSALGLSHPHTGGESSPWVFGYGTGEAGHTVTFGGTAV